MKQYLIVYDKSKDDGSTPKIWAYATAYDEQGLIDGIEDCRSKYGDSVNVRGIPSDGYVPDVQR